MKNYVHPGEVNTYTAPYAVSSGQGFQVGTEFAVALHDAGNGAAVEGMTRGVFGLPKSTAGSSGGTGLQGTKAYWDNTNKVVTKTAGSNLLIGYFRRDAADADTTFRVRTTGQAL